MILEEIGREEAWENFLQHKIEHQHLRAEEEGAIREFIEKKRYLPVYNAIMDGTFPEEYPVKKVINKEGVNKKRIVYSFLDDTSIAMKFIAHYLYCYDNLFSPNCYAFRRNYGVNQAMRRIIRHPDYGKKFCLKMDIHNYFNSINVNILMEKLSFLKADDPKLYGVLERMLLRPQVWEHGKLIEESHGVMAGTPMSPFLANWYLRELDQCFHKEGISYFRYSDDILVFADTLQELKEYKTRLETYFEQYHLQVNPEKEKISKPGETWEFLGFAYKDGRLDLSDNTKRKVKAKIKRKADALRRWQRKKQLPPEKAAIGFIRAMNGKFYGRDDPDDFTWKRWFFPNLTVDAGLREIDSYMQEYIRYTVTGRHYKGNYRIPYEQLKKWGYRNLVHEYYLYDVLELREHRGHSNPQASQGSGGHMSMQLQREGK